MEKSTKKLILKRLAEIKNKLKEYRPYLKTSINELEEGTYNEIELEIELLENENDLLNKILELENLG